MVHIKSLLPELKKLVVELADDLLIRSAENAAIDAGLREAYMQIERGGRTAQAFEVWRDDYLDQVAVAWVLACVFIRFMEDNQLIDECWLGGEGERRKLAEDTQTLFFREHPHDTDREYFQHVFREIGTIPAAKDLFSEGKTPLWAVAPSGDAAMALLKFWRELDAETGRLKRSFDVEPGDTRFLGDLYQELSERAKKKFALLQTPVFVEEFILDRTLTPAIHEFGLERVRMIDPTCGSGHFLLGGFARLFDLWSRRESNEIKAAQKALDGVWGVDINPFAVAIARFRLIVAAVRACGVKRLKLAPGWNIHLATGDSLLFGSQPTFGGERTPIAQQLDLFEVPTIYATEERQEIQAILGQGYHAVVGNPPYITVKDEAQNEAYRRLYSTCYRQYSLGVPFTQRFWELALQRDEVGAAGYVGMITANSFMKREFGKKLTEEFLPNQDLTHVIDTSPAHPAIESHGTATVILFGRNQRPVSSTLRSVLGIRSDKNDRGDPTGGRGWKAIVESVDIVGVQSEFLSVVDTPRTTYAHHPWSIGGGGASDLFEAINGSYQARLGNRTESIGRTSVVGEDDCWIMDGNLEVRIGVSQYCVPFGVGDRLRDWQVIDLPKVIYPYTAIGGSPLDPLPEPLHRWLWKYRTLLAERTVFGKSMSDNQKFWYEHLEHYVSKLRTPLSIAFAFVATHNHFVLDRGGKVFNRSAPVIKFSVNSNEEDLVGLLGLLNSSTVCFWLKQVCYSKGAGGINEGVKSEQWEQFREFSAAALEKTPVPDALPFDIAGKLDMLARQHNKLRPTTRLYEFQPSAEHFSEAAQSIVTKCRMIALQEELDWHCYQLYGLLSDDLRYANCDLPELTLGQRAFEIVMARQIARGELETTWFERHGSTPITETPSHWPTAYRTLVERRIELVETNKEIALVEKPEYKRRWNSEPWEEQEKRALKSWLLDRLETPNYRKGTNDHSELATTAQMADVASADAEFLQVAALYRGRPDFDLSVLVAELVESEAVPLLPILRYKPAGLRKRQVWERTWNLQRQQDNGDDVGDIPVPPKYTTADFLNASFWRLRGKLDVPKERWFSYPHCSTDSDPTLVVGWAGWNHLEQATALVAYYDARKREGWDAKRLAPLLSGLDQLLPWIHQWHPEIDKEFGETAGQSFQTMLEHDAHELGLTLDDIRNWQPPAKATKAKGRRKKKAEAEDEE